jgi:hypothetical protein
LVGAPLANYGRGGARPARVTMYLCVMVHTAALQYIGGSLPSSPAWCSKKCHAQMKVHYFPTRLYDAFVFFAKSDPLVKLMPHLTPSRNYFRVWPLRSARQYEWRRCCAARRHAIQPPKGGRRHTHWRRARSAPIPLAPSFRSELVSIICWRRGAQRRRHPHWRRPQGSDMKIVSRRG